MGRDAALTAGLLIHQVAARTCDRSRRRRRNATRLPSPGSVTTHRLGPSLGRRHNGRRGIQHAAAH